MSEAELNSQKGLLQDTISALNADIHKLQQDITLVSSKAAKEREEAAARVSDMTVTYELRLKDMEEQHATEVSRILHDLKQSQDAQEVHREAVHQKLQLLAQAEADKTAALASLQELHHHDLYAKRADHEAAMLESQETHRRELEGLHLEYRSLLSQIEEEVATQKQIVDASREEYARGMREKDQRHALALDAMERALLLKDEEIRLLGAAHQDAVEFVAEKYDVLMVEAQ